MLRQNVPAGRDLGVQFGVFRGVDPGQAEGPLAPLPARHARPFNPAELVVPDHALAQQPHFKWRVPLVLVLFIAEDAAGRFVIGIGLDGFHRQAVGRRRLMVVNAAQGQGEERGGLLLPEFHQPALPLGPIAHGAFRRVQRPTTRGRTGSTIV